MSCLVKHKRIHTRGEQGDSGKVENPADGDSSLHTCDDHQEKSPVSKGTTQVPSEAPQTAVNVSGLLTNRNLVFVGQPVARCTPSGDSMEFTQERNLTNAVNMVVPLVINYVLFYVTENP